MFTLANEKRRQRLQRFIKVYARMLLNGSIDWNKLGRVYNSKEALPDVKAHKILRNREVAQMVTDEIAKIYESNGITPDFILKERLNVLQLAKEKQDLTNANKVLESFESKLIDNKVTETRETQQISFVSMLDTGEKAKITGKRVIKQLDNSNTDAIVTIKDKETESNNE